MSDPMIVTRDGREVDPAEVHSVTKTYTPRGAHFVAYTNSYHHFLDFKNGNRLLVELGWPEKQHE